MYYNRTHEKEIIFIRYSRKQVTMKESSVFKSIKRLHETIKKQQGVMSPDSNGKGHGKLLRTIAENEGLSGAELSLMLQIAPPVVSEKLYGLEEDGMVRRERDKKDRRKTHVYITPDGEMALARRDFGRKKFEESIGKCLSEEEQALFCDMCDRMMKGVDEMSADMQDVDDNTIISFYEQQKLRREKKKQDEYEAERASENK